MLRKILLAIPVLLVIIYIAGPSPSKPLWSTTMPVVPQEPAALEQYIASNESKHKVKPDNEARIIWFDSTKKKTEYSVIYLHGFSASQEEGDPVHIDFAKKFGCNLYLSRLADHGIDTTEQLLNFTSDRFWESSKEALAIGKAIGEKVIVMSTSTGGTTALVLAADFPDDVHALINMSPNLAINDPNAWILNNHWGLQIARMVVGSNYNDVHFDSVRQKYWNGKYRMEATVQLQEMIESKMNKETFSKVLCPSLTLYYYKNEQEQDPTVKVSAMLEMNKELGTPESFKQTVAIPDAGAHVIGSYLTSKDLKSVESTIDKFAIEKLKLQPLN